MNTILLEQVITVDQYAMKDYICMLTDETLEKIEKALSIQYSIRPQLLYGDFELSNVIGSLEAIVERIITSKMNTKPQATITEVEDVAVRLGQMIEDLVGVPEPKTEIQDASVCGESQPIQKSEPQSKPQQPEKNTEKPVVQASGVKTKDKSVQNRTATGRMRWTDESRRQYLKDCEELSPQDVMKKYGFTSMKSVFQTKYMCKNVLGVE